MLQPKLVNIEMLSNEHGECETESDIIEELIQEESDDYVK